MIKRAQQSRAGRLISIFLVAAFFVSLLPNNTFAGDLDSEYYSVGDYSYKIETVVTSSWNNHVNIELNLKNTDDRIIDNWYLTFQTPYTIENIWNASILETDNHGTYTIRNNYYNQDIDINSDVSIGMTLNIGNSKFDRLSNWYLLNTKKTEIGNDKYLVSYQEYSKWNGGYNGALILSSQDYIEDWSLTFYSEYTISSISNANIDICEDGLYVVTNDGNTQNLNLSMLFLSIQGIPTENEFELSNIDMYSIELAYSLTEDADNNGIADYQDFINLKEGKPSVTPTPSVEPTITPPLDTPTSSVTVTPEPTTTESEYNEYLDYDNDGLLNFEEDLYGTDKYNNDSDDDMIDDFTEIMIGYDPNNPDSDNNFILDKNEDFDKDGIINATEIEIGSCLFFPDTDFDNISDYDEIYVYGTNPNKEDSNNDGILDGDALELGLDPASLDSDQDGIPDKDEKIFQKMELQIEESSEFKGVSSVEIMGEFTNLITSTTTIEDVYGKDVYSSEIEAIIGGLVSIETTSEFDTATIIFHYDKEEIGVDEDDLCILWYDEENDEYVMLYDDQILNKENCTISYTTSHFSTYLLISRQKWLKQWESSLRKASSAQLKYSYLANQESKPQYILAAQMTSYDNIEWRALEKIAYDTISEQLTDANYGGLVLYAGVALADAVWTKEGYDSRFNEYVYNYYIDQANSPDISNMLNIAAFIRQTLSSPNIVLYLITEETSITLAEEDFEILEENGLIVKVISTQPDFTLINETDLSIEVVCYEGNESKFVESISNIFDESVPLCSDSDNFTDYQEKCGFVLSNGSYITTLEYKDDSDEDGLSDSEEICKEYELLDLKISSDDQFRQLFEKYAGRIKCWSFVSDPTKNDTDMDLIDDAFDARPKIENPIKIYVFCSNKDVFEGNDTDLVYRANTLKTRYENEGFQVELKDSITNVKSFIEAWNNIGILLDNYGNKPYGDKYYYSSELVIVTHGDHLRLCFSDDSCLCYDSYRAGATDYLSIESLPKKKINGLYLYSCYCGGNNSTVGTCIAEQLASTGWFGGVYAFDTSLLIVGDSYMGFWYHDEKVVSHDEFDAIKLTRYAKKGFLDLEYEPVGFVEYTQQGGKIIKKDIYQDDILYGIKYSCENEVEDGCDSKFSVIVQAKYPDMHDPLMDKLQSIK